MENDFNRVTLSDDDIRNFRQDPENLERSSSSLKDSLEHDVDGIIGVYIIPGPERVRMILTPKSVIYALPEKLWFRYSRKMLVWLSSVSFGTWFCDQSYMTVCIEDRFIDWRHKTLYVTDDIELKRKSYEKLFVKNFIDNDACYPISEDGTLGNIYKTGHVSIMDRFNDRGMTSINYDVSDYDEDSVELSNV